MIDALIRLLPGVLGNENSTLEESFENNLLEYPQYTKPREWEGKKVPEVLFSGDHAKIKGWRLSQSEAITRRQRPDLWKKYTEKNLYQDARKSIEWLNRKGINNKDIILYGESLGTGVATELAQSNSFHGIVLESPFTSIADAAKIYYPYLPVNLLLKDRYDSIKKIKNIKIPILIMHGKKDNIVPFFMGEKLYQMANEPKYKYFSEEDDHMMEFNDDLLNAVKAILNFNS